MLCRCDESHGEVQGPHGGRAENLLLVGKVRKPSWRKGFPGAEVGKTGGSWPGEDGLEERGGLSGVPVWQEWPDGAVLSWWLGIARGQ